MFLINSYSQTITWSTKNLIYAESNQNNVHNFLMHFHHKVITYVNLPISRTRQIKRLHAQSWVPMYQLENFSWTIHSFHLTCLQDVRLILFSYLKVCLSIHYVFYLQVCAYLIMHIFIQICLIILVVYNVNGQPHTCKCNNNTTCTLEK